MNLLNKSLNLTITITITAPGGHALIVLHIPDFSIQCIAMHVSKFTIQKKRPQSRRMIL